MKKILITDSLYIFPKHVRQLQDAGYEVERLDKPDASEAELAEAIRGKAGYILGGVEHVTNKVIDAADGLEAIVFTGIGYSFIPAVEHARAKGIVVQDLPDSPTDAVAEWSMAAALAMTRGLFDLARTGGESFTTTTGLKKQSVGIVGLGRIGSRIAELLAPFGPAAVAYYSAHRHPDKEQSLGVQYKDLPALLNGSDVVFLCVSDEVGKDFFSNDQFQAMKEKSLLVSFMEDTGIINKDALYTALQSGKIRAISDYPMDERFGAFPLSVWYSFNGSNAANTIASVAATSDAATELMISLLARAKPA